MDDITERVNKSREGSARMKSLFGFMPLSVLNIGRGPLSKKIYHYLGEQATTTGRGDRIDGELITTGTLGLSGAGSRGASRRDNPSYSVMPADLVAFFIKYYARRGQVYLDPFMGQGVRMQVAYLMGLDYWGYDLSGKFVKYIRKVHERIGAPESVHIFLGDSRTPEQIPDGIGDFSFHSPPYWNVEHYGEEPGQLGHRSYQEFLVGMKEVASAWLPKFKPGAFHAVNVGDIRAGGKFYNYHGDLISLFIEAGWLYHDIWILGGGVVGLSRVFARRKNAAKTAPRVHEYVLVFRKPNHLGG